MKLDKVDWFIIVTCVGLTGYIVWVLMDDPVNRRLSYLHHYSDTCKAIAEHFGKMGIAAEVEYYRVLETQRTT